MSVPVSRSSVLLYTTGPCCHSERLSPRPVIRWHNH